MVFLANYLLTVGTAYWLGREYSKYKLTNGALFALLLPILFLWLFICGGQDEVGTDYLSYLSIFNGNQYHVYINNHEYLFIGIVALFNSIGIYGQSLFFVFYGINFIFLFLIVKRIPRKQIFIFLILYMVVTSLFNNQLNILRQTTAIYIGTYAAFLIFENKKIKGLIFIILAFFIHQSAIVLLILYAYKFFLRIFSYKALLVCLLAAFLCSLVLKIDSLVFILPFLSADYAWHIEGGAVEETGLITKLTKYIFIPLYLLSWWRFRKENFSDKDIILFKCGWIAFCLRLSLVNLSIVSRIFDYFLILSVFPLLQYLYCLFKARKTFLFLCIIFGLTLFYCVKVTIFARAEYLYKSIYF